LNFLNHIKKTTNSFIIGNSNMETLGFWLILFHNKNCCFQHVLGVGGSSYSNGKLFCMWTLHIFEIHQIEHVESNSFCCETKLVKILTQHVQNNIQYYVKKLMVRHLVQKSGFKQQKIKILTSVFFQIQIKNKHSRTSLKMLKK
jgi:hypothetical protein